MIRKKSLGLKKTSYAYPEKYDVVYIPEDNFFRQLLNLDLKIKTIGIISYKYNTVECYPVVSDSIRIHDCVYSRYIPEKYGDANIPQDMFEEIKDSCFRKLVKYFRFRKC
jgi:hypothetical protein